MERDNDVKQIYVLNTLIREIPVTDSNFERDTGYNSRLLNNAPWSLRLCPMKCLCDEVNRIRKEAVLIL